jgi:hypothetical protein
MLSIFWAVDHICLWIFKVHVTNFAHGTNNSLCLILLLNAYDSVCFVSCLQTLLKQESPLSKFLWLIWWDWWCQQIHEPRKDPDVFCHTDRYVWRFSVSQCFYLICYIVRIQLIHISFIERKNKHQFECSDKLKKSWSSLKPIEKTQNRILVCCLKQVTSFMFFRCRKDLRRKSEEQEIRHIVNRGLHSAYR